MIKVIAASALALGMATSAFAQAGTGSSSDGGAPGGQPVAPAVEGSSSTGTGSMSTAPAAGSTSDATNSGVQGSSAAGSNENCPPETPGAGTKAPSQSAEKNPACTD